MQVLQADLSRERAQLWVPRETYLRERVRAERAEAVAVRLHRAQRARIARPAPPELAANSSGALLGLCIAACIALSVAMFTLPFVIPPTV